MPDETYQARSARAYIDENVRPNFRGDDKIQKSNRTPWLGTVVATIGFSCALAAARYATSGLFGGEGGGPIPEQEWKLHQESKRFRVMLPGSPTRKVQQAGGGIEMIGQELTYSRNLEFIVGHTEGPVPYERRRMFELVLNDSCDGMKKEVGKKMEIVETRRESIDLGGFPGKRLTLDIPDRKGQAILCVYFTGEHLYVAGLIGRGYAPGHEVTKRFFDSFELLEPGPSGNLPGVTPKPVENRPSAPTSAKNDKIAMAPPTKKSTDVASLPSAISRPSAKTTTDPSGLKSTEVRGGLNDPEFREVAKPGGLLIGFEVGLGKFVNKEVVHTIRPVYRNEANETYGREWGRNFTRIVRAVAKPGYAVGAVTVKTGLGVDGLSVTFMKIANGQLSPSDSYESDWIGSTGIGASKLAGDGVPVVGILGKTNRNGEVSGLGLLQK